MPQRVGSQPNLVPKDNNERIDWFLKSVETLHGSEESHIPPVFTFKQFDYINICYSEN